MNHYLIGPAIALLLAGCGGGPQAVPQSVSSAAIPQERLAKSWMLPEAKSEDLIYATAGCGGTCIISYPGGKLVGSLYGVGDTGACADSAGDVYVSIDSQLQEFAHGGTTPIATFNVASSGLIAGCAVDAVTGNVAVVAILANGYNIAVFAPGNQTPTTYTVDLAQYCGYDNKGNLFVDSWPESTNVALFELPNGGTSFQQIAINRNLPIDIPAQVQWDGKYLSIEDISPGYGIKIYRLSLAGSQATLKDTVPIRAARLQSGSQSWIDGGRIFVPYATRRLGNKLVGVWAYPKGGKPESEFKGIDKEANFQGITFSPASSK